MPRKTAGYRYPFATTAAREHDHRMCKVVEAIAERVIAGREDWGVIHPMPPVPDEHAAKKIRGQFTTAKFCKILERKYGELMSVKCVYELTGAGYVLSVQVWPRSIARKEIIRRVKAGEPLAYNPLREKT